MGLLGNILGGDDDVCHGTYGTIETEDGHTQGIEMTCPDGDDYVIPGDKDEAERKAREQVLAECDGEESHCHSQWRAKIFDNS